MVTTVQFELYQLIVRACEMKALIFTNGNDYYLLDGDRVMHVNIVDQTKKHIVGYMNDDMDEIKGMISSINQSMTKEIVENFLKHCVLEGMCERAFESVMSHGNAMDMVRSAARSGRFYHTNGAWWTIEACGTIMSIELFGGYNPNGQVRTMAYSLHGAWAYKAEYSPIKPNEDVRKVLSI